MLCLLLFHFIFIKWRAMLAMRVVPDFAPQALFVTVTDNVRATAT